MTFLQTGISLAHAPLEVLERVAVSGDTLSSHASELSGLLGGQGCATILSTCNRTELYAYVPDAGTAMESMVAFMQQLADRQRDQSSVNIAAYVATRTDIECARHLFAVASSLDSLVAGDAQVAGQVRSALHAASDGSAAVDHGLSRLFHAALRTGRRVRRAQGEQVADATVPAAGVELLEARAGSLAGATAMVVGAGEMARLAVAELQRRRVARVFITSRNSDNAARVAEAMGATAVTIDDITDALAGADVVVACTSSPVPVVSADVVSAAISLRGDTLRPLHILDIGVPRDIDARVSSLDGAHLYTIEHLRDAYGKLRDAASDSSAVAEMEDLVEESALRFMRDWDTRGEIREIGRAAEAVRLREQRRTFGALAHLSDSDRDAIEAMTRAIVKGVLAGQIEELRERDE